MCDLNSEERDHIGGGLNEIAMLADQVRAHASSITETAYMDHEKLAELLVSLRDKAGTAGSWVSAKPLQHSGHSGHSDHSGSTTSS